MQLAPSEAMLCPTSGKDGKSRNTWNASRAKRVTDDAVRAFRQNLVHLCQVADKGLGTPASSQNRRDGDKHVNRPPRPLQIGRRPVGRCLTR